MKRTSLVSVIFVFCLFGIGCRDLAYRMPTNSMLPTISKNDMAVNAPNYYKNNPIERFDIVVLEMPDFVKQRTGEKGDIKIIERVIGLPNEKIEIKKGRVFINDVELKQNFDYAASEDDFGPMTIPANEYFLLGDNREDSLDSRYWKPATVKKEDIYSKIVEVRKDFYTDK